MDVFYSLTCFFMKKEVLNPTLHCEPFAPTFNLHVMLIGPNRLQPSRYCMEGQVSREKQEPVT